MENVCKLYCITNCDTIEKNRDSFRERYYSKNIFNKIIYKTLLAKAEKDYNNSLLGLEKLLNEEYKI